MEELQKLVHILLNPQQNYSNEVKVQTQAQSEKIIADHAQDCAYFFQVLESSADIYTKFWTIDAICRIVARYYPSYSPALKQQLHDLYFATLERNPMAVLANPCIENRYALVFVGLIRASYPTVWPSAFVKLLSLLCTELAGKSIEHKLRYTSTDMG